MQGRFMALSSKYNLHHVPNFTNMHYVSLNSHRIKIYYNINHILRDAVFSLFEGAGIRKTTL